MTKNMLISTLRDLEADRPEVVIIVHFPQACQALGSRTLIGVGTDEGVCQNGIISYEDRPCYIKI